MKDNVGGGEALQVRLGMYPVVCGPPFLWPHWAEVGGEESLAALLFASASVGPWTLDPSDRM